MNKYYYMSLFLMTLEMIVGRFKADYNFFLLLESFKNSFYESNKDIMDKVLDNSLIGEVLEDDLIGISVCLRYFDNIDKRNDIFEYVGREDTDKISDLAVLFVDYLNVLYNDSYRLILKH